MAYTIAEVIDNLVASLRAVQKLRNAYDATPRNLDDVIEVIRDESVLLIRFDQLSRSPVFRNQYRKEDPLKFVVGALGEKGMHHEIERMMSRVGFQNNLRRAGFNFPGYQIHSYMIANLLVEAFTALPTLQNSVRADPMFADGDSGNNRKIGYYLHFAGMTHDLGKLIVAEAFPEIYEQMRSMFANRLAGYTSVLDKESSLLKRKLGIHKYIDHAVLAALVLAKLGFHRSMQYAVREHHRQSASSSSLSKYLYLSHALFARTVGADSDNELLARIDRRALAMFCGQYGLQADEVLEVLVKVEDNTNQYLKHFALLDPEERPSEVRIVQESPTEEAFRVINNSVFETIDPLEELDQVYVISEMIKRFSQRLQDYYVPVVYFVLDVANHTDIFKKLNPALAQTAMKTFHDSVKLWVSRHGRDVLKIVNVVGDSYTLLFKDVETAISFYRAALPQVRILSQRAGVKFSLYYYIHAGRDLKCAILDGGERHSGTLNELGHIGKAFKKPDLLIISQAVLFQLAKADQLQFAELGASQDGVLVFVEAPQS